jgi:hypothetical protein
MVGVWRVDLNKDGFDDILIGAPLANGNHGNAYVIFGSASPVDSSISQLGDLNGITLNASLASNNGFGSSVALEKNMGTNTRGLFVSSVPPVAATSFLYYLHDFTASRTPSVVPTDSPSVTPMQTPTLVPSVDPTMTPTAVPTVVPSFRPSAPAYSPSTMPTATPTRRSKSAIIINAGLTMNSVNGATLTPTSQETVKQSFANASQTTVNNVDLVSVTRINRRLLSSVVHRMLATAALFSYKVVAEIHFSLIDFPGLNESYVAGTKSNVLFKAITTHEFDRIISYYATINKAVQLMNSVTASDVTITISIIPAADDSSGSKDDLTVGEIVGIAVSAVVGAFLLTVLIYFAMVQSRSQSEARRSIPMVELDYTPVSISERVARSDNAMVDITKVYQDSSDKEFDRFKKLQMTISSPAAVKL